MIFLEKKLKKIKNCYNMHWESTGTEYIGSMSSSVGETKN